MSRAAIRCVACVCFTEYKDLANKWLTFNEINILIHLDFNHDKSKSFLKLHHQMVAAAKAVQVAHDIDPEDVLATYKAFVYCADIMVRGYYPSYAWRQHHVDLAISPEDKENLMKGKADFLAFSYYGSLALTTHKDGEEKANGNFFNSVKNPYAKPAIGDGKWINVMALSMAI